MSIQLRYAARSDIGLVRKNNQDSGYAGPHLLVLADGMGGPAGGDIASSVAIAHLAALDGDSHGAEDLLALLREAISAAHEELVTRAQSDESLAGLGTTCIAILRSGNKMAMVHIGDSRAYLLRDSQLTQVTRDHSFVQFLVETGQLSPEEAEHHPQRSVLLRVLGDNDGDVTLDESVREAIVGDRWLLCSDGLSGVVSMETINTVLSEVADPGECADELVSLALRGGGPDNITCVIADVVDGDTESTPTAAQVVGAAGKAESRKLSQAKTPAEKAAALRQAALPQAYDPGEKPTRDPRALSVRGWVIGVLVSLLVIGGVCLGSYWGYQWTQKQFYLGLKDGNVMVFQGIPQHIGSLELSAPIQDTGIKASELPEVVQARLEETVPLDELSQADELLASWSELIPKPAPSPSASPAETPAATPSSPGAG